MVLTDEMVSFWIFCLVYLTAFNSVECADSGCRPITPQDAMDTTKDLKLFALSSNGYRNPVTQILIVPESTESFILIRDLDSFNHDYMPPGLTKAVMTSIGTRKIGTGRLDVPDPEIFTRPLQKDDSRLDTYVFYTGESTNRAIATVFDTVVAVDGFYKNFFPGETHKYSVVKFTNITQVERPNEPVVLLAPKTAMVYVNCNSVPTTTPVPPTNSPEDDIKELKDQMKLLTTKLKQQEVLITSLKTKTTSGVHMESGFVRFSETNGRWTNTFHVSRGPECTIHRCTYRSYTRVVVFKKHFSKRPEILTSVTRVFTHKSLFKVEVKDVTSTGFKLVCSTPHDFKVNNVFVNWIAFPKA